jgi:hypothetical protein
MLKIYLIDRLSLIGNRKRTYVKRMIEKNKSPGMEYYCYRKTGRGIKK